MNRSSRLQKNSSGVRGLPPAAGSRFDFAELTARVELVPFPKPARIGVLPQPVKPCPFKTDSNCTTTEFQAHLTLLSGAPTIRVSLLANFISGVPDMRLMSNKKLALLGVWLTLASMAAFGQSAQHQSAQHEVLIKNATVMTATHGNIKNGSVYI